MFCSFESVDMLIAPGDVLAVKGQGGSIIGIGSNSGLFGHVVVALGNPRRVHRNAIEAHHFSEVWPAGNVQDLWLVHTMESTRSESGLFQADLVLYVDSVTGQLTTLAEVGLDGELTHCDNCKVQVWQSPPALRGQLRPDLVWEVVKEMDETTSDWSKATAARAFLRSASLTKKGNGERFLRKLRSYWANPPICTSVVIVFWQRYLCKMADAANSAAGAKYLHPSDLVLRWMPIKADRVLPGQLLDIMQKTGWRPLARIPQVFHPSALQM